MIVSSEVSAIFDDLEYFHVSNASPEQDQYNMGIEKIGSLGGRYTVYRDPYAPANSIIVGHKYTKIRKYYASSTNFENTTQTWKTH